MSKGSRMNGRELKAFLRDHTDTQAMDASGFDRKTIVAFRKGLGWLPLHKRRLEEKKAQMKNGLKAGKSIRQVLREANIPHSGRIAGVLSALRKEADDEQRQLCQA
jgi:hypothetical protein